MEAVRLGTILLTIYQILVSLRRRWVDNIKMDLREIELTLVHILSEPLDDADLNCFNVQEREKGIGKMNGDRRGI
jgi:hypothetical protein